MKKTLIIFALYTASLYQSQTNRFTYELQYRKETTDEYRKSLMNLDISPKSVKFYDKDFADYDLKNKEANQSVSHYSTKTDQVVEREPESFNNRWYRDFFEYFVVKTHDEMNWQVLNETKEYNGYKLQKATTDFGGRSWSAWFSNEVNIKEGPYKFGGLPGLIFILEDTDKNFIYKLINNEKLVADYDTKDFVETHYGKPALPITNEKFNTYIEDIYQNPTRLFSEKIKNGGNLTFKNESVESVEELNRKKEMLQKGIKGRYIYIEKDKEPLFKG
ncbi:GLPGLI family protein [Chryseobacterium sp. MEBOG06]|uniref:GLPGLI family protein n=1 Tax=Chryseobacterium sp. MEBOG06 TaxID=2879938 RepID=UPI001F419C9E|nr:GLPGLI family protein [Chryseobacterium sp. MEBOG06]UKB85903.1 GLPGLI family protein [Chryseobacterium sp. MEBOG06]